MISLETHDHMTYNYHIACELIDLNSWILILFLQFLLDSSLPNQSEKGLFKKLF